MKLLHKVCLKTNCVLSDEGGGGLLYTINRIIWGVGGGTKDVFL